MLSDRLAPFVARRNFFYGWIVVGVAFFATLMTAATLGMPGAFIIPLSKEFGWDTAQISIALSIRIVLFGVLAPFAATFIDRYGMRTMMLISLTLLFVSLICVQGISFIWQLIFLWGFVDGLATGMTSMALGATMANRWFTDKRGLVIGVMTAAVATGQMIFLPVTAALIESFGWRFALWPLIVCIGIAAILVFFFMRERPAELDLPPLGEQNVIQSPKAKGSPLEAIKRSLSVLRVAIRSPMFWVLSGSFFVCGLSTNGLIQTHFIPFCADYGVGAVLAASTLAFMGIFVVIGSLGSGYLSDRFDNRWLLFWYYGLRGLSLIYLPFSDFSVLGLTIFAIVYGMDWIATVPPTVKLAGGIFGRENAAIVFGWIFTAHQIGASVAAIGGGYSRTAFLTYLPAFIVAGIACLIAAGLVLTVQNKGGGATVSGKTAPA